MSVQRRYLSKGLRVKQKIFVWLRTIIGIFLSISLAIFGGIWILSAGHVVSGEWSIILPITFGVLGVVFTLCQWLFPFSSAPEEQTANDVTLIKASELRHENFNLGDDSAAKFQYIVEPVQEAYNSANQILYSIDSGTKVTKYGLLIIGESNAGKTRLALEVLTATLPEWLVLQWNLSYSLQNIPTIQSDTKGGIVVFIDDIQKYVGLENNASYTSTDLSDIKIEIIQVLLSKLRESSRQVIIICTCREEDEIRARAKLSHFFENLKVIRMNKFNSDPQSIEAKNIINKFERKGAQYCKDWDGTIGSLVLGLSRKKSLYNNLILHNDLGAILLKSMKLLTLAGTTIHTDFRLKAVSAKIFGAEELLRNEKVWRTTVEKLKLLQFIKRSIDNHLSILLIRKDAYFENIIEDYNDIHAKQDFIALQQVLIEIGDTKALFNLGIVYLELKWYEEAISLANDALKLDSKDAYLWVLKGLPYGNVNGLGRPLEALAAFNRAIALNPNDGFALEFRGITYGALGQYEKALSDFNCALALNFDGAVIQAFKGNALEELGHYQDALVSLDLSLELDPTDFKTWNYKSSVLRSLTRLDEALAAIDQALALDPTNADIWNNKAFILRDLNRLEEAFVAFNRSLELDSNSTVTWHGKAKVSIGLEKDEEALIAVNHALALSPNDVDVLCDKGLLFMLLKRYEEAILVWNHIIELDSKHVDALHFLGVAYRLSEHYKEAIVALNQACILDPNNTDIWLNKGIVLGIQENYEESLSALNQALYCDPDNVDAWVFKGSVFNTMGNHEEALSSLNKALALDPSRANTYEPFLIDVLTSIKDKEQVD